MKLAKRMKLMTPEIVEQPMINQPYTTLKFGSQTVPNSAEKPCTFTDAGSSHYAGCRVAGIYELLELCLLELQVEDLLLAQRVNRRFNAIINTSPRLREKLFFTSRLAFGNAFRAKLNPLIMREDVMRAIPLFFYHEEKRLVSCYREGFTRLYCRSITATTVWVYLEFSSEKPPSSSEEAESCHQTRTLERGSWERMYVSQPGYFFSWRVQLSQPEERVCGACSGEVRETYSGIVKGAKTMGSLLDGLVESLVVRQ